MDENDYSDTEPEGDAEGISVDNVDQGGDDEVTLTQFPTKPEYPNTQVAVKKAFVKIKKVKKCLLCQNKELKSLFDIGNLYVSNFVCLLESRFFSNFDTSKLPRYSLGNLTR